MPRFMEFTRNKWSPFAFASGHYQSVLPEKILSMGHLFRMIILHKLYEFDLHLMTVSLTKSVNDTMHKGVL